MATGQDSSGNQAVPAEISVNVQNSNAGAGNAGTNSGGINNTNSGGAGNTGTGGGGSGGIQNPAPNYLVDIRDFGSLLTRAIGWMLYFAGGIAVLFLLVGGFQYIAARGNEEATEKAKKTITGAVIGIVIIIMAYAIVTIVSNLVTRNPGA